MATTSTVPTVKAQLVTQIKSALTDASEQAVTVSYAWPGPDTGREAVFLGPHPETNDIRLDRDSQPTSIKAGRQRRQENYTVRITVWVFSPHLDPQEAATCEARAFALAAHIEDLIADTPRIGLAASVIQGTHITTNSSTLFPFQAGWACELGIDLDVDAYLV